MRTQLSYVHSTIQGEIMKRQHGTVPSMSSKIINDFFPFFKYDHSEGKTYRSANGTIPNPW